MYDSIDNEKILINKRLELVRFANENGIKVAARFYSCSKKNIKKRCKRYAVYGIAGLKDKSRKPKNSSKRINTKDILEIKECVENAKEKNKYITVNNVRKKTKIKSRGYSPLDKIKMAEEIDSIIFPKPQLLTV